MEKNIEDAEEKVESVGVEPEDMEQILEGAGERAVSTEGKAESIKETAAPSEGKTEDIEEKGMSAEEKTEDTEERETSAEEKTEDTEERETSAEKKAAVENALPQNEGEKQDGKKKISRAKITGYMELAAAFILALLSGGLFFNTRGTRLLYVSVATGRVSRYYCFFLLAALISLMMGVFTLKFCRREEKENLLGRDEKVGENTDTEEDV